MSFIALFASYTAWEWLRPYEWKPDPQAKAEIVGVELTRDHSFYWLEVHARASDGKSLDLTRPARLVVDGGRELMPADTRLEGSAEKGFREVRFKFWLDSQDLEATLALALHEGMLTVKSSRQVPVLKEGKTRYFTSHRW